MTAEEYFDEWWTPKELPENGFNKTAMLDFAEMYHKQALTIPAVVEQSEQFYCNDEKHYPEIGRCKNECDMCMQERIKQ
jgi:hypothetical protein